MAWTFSARISMIRASASDKSYAVTSPRPRQCAPAELVNMRQQFMVLNTEGHQVLDRDVMSAFARLYNMNTQLVDHVGPQVPSE
jgi:hypothetical protein